jgi:nicotinamide-nucleotide amidase
MYKLETVDSSPSVDKAMKYRTFMIQNDVLELLGDIKKNLDASSQTVATAESCTGGILATLLTHLPGSSKSYLGGVSAYANSVKSNLLEVDPNLISTHGAVSAPVVEAMATGAKSKIGSTYALSLSGIAGPGGGTTAKPVGTVFCGFASPNGVTSFLWQISGDREKIRQEAAIRALRMLKKALDDTPPAT